MASEVEALALARSLCDVLDQVRGERDETYEQAVVRLSAEHDRLMTALVAIVTSLGGGVKLHGLQLKLAEAGKLEFKVVEPFLEIYVRPAAERPMVTPAGSMAGLPPPPGGKSS